MVKPIHHTALLLNAADVAKMLRVSERNVWRMVKACRFPKPVRLDGMRGTRWRLEDVQKYIRGLK